MCGIGAFVGAIPFSDMIATLVLNEDRGRDGFGIASHSWALKYPGGKCNYSILRHEDIGPRNMLFNFRAEPTLERVENPTHADQQPYKEGWWLVVHNGTIANDKELVARHGLHPPTKIDSWVIAGVLNVYSQLGYTPKHAFEMMLSEIKGSFAIIAKYTTGETFYARDFRPLQFRRDDLGTIIASSVVNGHDVAPYSWGMVTPTGIYTRGYLRSDEADKRAVVVHSGGLDSTVVAAMLIHEGYAVTLLHFDYGCRATTPERKAVEDIGRELDVPVRIIDTDLFRKIGHSRLIGGGQIDNGEAGAETAIEWVPARNSIMAMIAAGIAEAEGFGIVALGVNLEEAGGGYTDNCGELYDGFNDVAHMIVGYGKDVRFVMPLRTMMKHEIVEVGLRVGAPFSLTWSCYNAGTTHCGNCGPCLMRRKAFEMNGKVDPVFACAPA